MPSASVPLKYLQEWQPFRIDALGLVTLLGAEEIDRCVGRLVHNRFFEYFPLVSAFLIANNKFATPVPGFALYNISDAIMTNEISGWLSRWLLTQSLPRAGAKLEWIVSMKARSVWKQECTAVVVASFFTGPLIALSGLMGDWWGLANVVAMLVSVITRWYVVGGLRRGLDRAALRGAEQLPTRVKLLCVSPDGKAIIMHAPRGLVIEGFTRQPEPENHRLYRWSRVIGWVAFGTHVITIGMCSLLVQIYSVVILLVASALLVYRVGADDSRICRHLSVETNDTTALPRNYRRQRVYVDLDLSAVEEQCMVDWNLFPHRSNQKWWDEYFLACKQEREKSGESKDKEGAISRKEGG